MFQFAAKEIEVRANQRHLNGLINDGWKITSGKIIKPIAVFDRVLCLGKGKDAFNLFMVA